MKHKRTYDRESIERAFDLHGIEYTELKGTSRITFVVQTGLGDKEMELRDAYFYCNGLADKGRLMTRGTVTA